MQDLDYSLRHFNLNAQGVSHNNKSKPKRVPRIHVSGENRAQISLNAQGNRSVQPSANTNDSLTEQNFEEKVKLIRHNKDSLNKDQHLEITKPTRFQSDFNKKDTQEGFSLRRLKMNRGESLNTFGVKKEADSGRFKKEEKISEGRRETKETTRLTLPLSDEDLDRFVIYLLIQK